MTISGNPPLLPLPTPSGDRRLKSDQKPADIPIIMVTALNEMGDIERAIQAGTDDFVSKPINK
jgi:two-component system alkaline phosphatase synthesis response regulator PhoP